VPAGFKQNMKITNWRSKPLCDIISDAETADIVSLPGIYRNFKMISALLQAMPHKKHKGKMCFLSF